VVVIYGPVQNQTQADVTVTHVELLHVAIQFFLTSFNLIPDVAWPELSKSSHRVGLTFHAPWFIRLCAIANLDHWTSLERIP
jgi:hypothetical protein